MPEHPQASEEAEEPSPLEYARSNGLSRDYLAERLGFSDLEQLQHDVDAKQLDSSHLRQFNLGSEIRVEERLTISKDAALLLSSINREEASEDIDSLVVSMLETRTLGWPPKLELSLLRSNHETDCREFASREGFEIKLQDVKLPLELVDDEKNEGLSWPSRFWDMGQETLQKLKAEKLAVSKDTFMFINDCLKDDWTEDDAKALWGDEQKYKKNTALEPVTPPLSPGFKPLQQPYEPSPSDPAYQLPLLSSPASPTKQQLEDIEKLIFEQDVPTPVRNSRAIKQLEPQSSDPLPDESFAKLGDIYSPLASLENTPPSIEVKRVKREDLKVEETLTPDRSGIAPPKSVRFSDIIEELQLYPDSRGLTPACEDKFFEEAFGDALREANQRAEQEKLVAADATARVDVPIMDFTKADPPWKDFEGAQNHGKLLSLQMSLIREVLSETPPKLVHFNHKSLNLRWNPWPSNLAKIAEEESFEDDDQKLKAFINEMEAGNIIDSTSLTWKQPGLRVLKDDEDDDEIDPGVFGRDTPLDLASLAKKRKMELQEAEGARDEPAPKKVAPAAQQMPPPKQLPTGAFGIYEGADGKLKRVDAVRGGGGSELLGGAFSAESCLDNFLELRGSKKAKLTDNTYFVTKPNTAQPAPTPQTLRTTTPQIGTTQLPIRKSPVVKAPPLPAPSLPAGSTITTIVVSSALLKHRALIKHLERLLPELNIIERDFTAHNTTTWLLGSVTRSPIKSPLDSEADIIVSPSTGIVITTLQKIKQRPLPGQNSKKPAIRERIEQVSSRYEKLIVFVTEGRGDETTIGLDDNDCSAYSEFGGFAAGFETSITVLFVVGGEETLSKWLVSTIVQNCLIGESNLLAEESYWELFLRRAGLNAYAAQTVVANLKAPDGVDPNSPTKAGQFGLTAFVEMGREQRNARFGPLCGRMLMERVSAMIDGRWE
ncbi:uncharacterized protein PAC_13306 [Phialocephala subalpina]|uniref:Uncharacterized protein n=1 Tax=Phialocephala subalpina TaxID=576137 RepID=A0A1L7XED9_9HELO|nr:uncharacterized protein PAC_13306 [Phialocephala subalpina]